MPMINDFRGTESFISNKLVEAQLDSFRVYSLELQLNFLGTSGDGLQSYWLCITGDINFYDHKNIYRKRSEVIGNLYALIGQRVSSIKIEVGGVLLLHCANKAIRISMNDDDLEVVWSFTPESPDIYEEHCWSVILTDQPELVMSRSS